MKIIAFSNLNKQYKFWKFCPKFVVLLGQTSEVWLFNCDEGTQHKLLEYRIKLSLISKIFITNLSIDNISGLPGLLSTLSLDSRTKALHIYGSYKLQYYLKFNNKYSQTNFSYPIKIHSLDLHSIVSDMFYAIRCIPLRSNISIYQRAYTIILKQNSGKFNVSKAILFNLIKGPLYGKLKKPGNFLTPDGYEIQGKQFSSIPQKGYKTIILPYVQYNKIFAELCWKVYDIACIA